MSVGGVRREPDLVPTPRPRTPRFRPRLGPALPGLYPLHVVLAGVVAGLLAGPRAVAGVVAGVVVVGGAGLALARSPVVFRVPIERVDDAELDLLVPGRPSFREVPALRVGAALIASAVAVLAGAVVAQERLAVLDRTALVPRDDVRLVGFAVEPPRLRSFGTTLVPISVGNEKVLVRAPDRVRMPDVRVGDEVVVRGRLRLRPREKLERRRGVHGVVEADGVRLTGRTRGSPVDAVRRRAESALGVQLSPEQSALARGMVLGQDHALPDDLRDAFRAAGLAHLLAASGQNVMLLAALVLALSAAFGVTLRARLALAVGAVAFYVPLAGAGPSIQRAGVMGAAGLVAALAGRPASRWYAVLLAASATLALNPRAAEDVGWQLSFAAVIAILALHRRLRRALLGGDGGPEPDAGRAAAADRTDRLRHLTERLTNRWGDLRAHIDRNSAHPASAGAPGRGWADSSTDDVHGSAHPSVSVARTSDPASVVAVTAVAGAAGGKRARRVQLAFRDAVADVAALTIAATLGTAPLLCLHFGELSLVSLPANLLAAPAVAPVMWLGTLAAITGGAGAEALNPVAAVPLSYLAWLGRTAASVPHASVAVQLPGVGAAVVAYAVIAAACSIRLGPRARQWLVNVGVARRGPWTLEARAAGTPAPLRPRWATVAPLGVLLGASALIAAPGPPQPPAGPTLSLLNVGQGDAVLLQDGPRAALFDTGKPGSPLVSELRKAGVKRLDLVVITHSSADHEGGLRALLKAMPVGMVLDGRGPGREAGGEGGGARFEDLPPGLPRGIPEQGQRFSVGRIAVEILWPPAGEPRNGDPNATATVAVARTNTTSALLTADAESEVTLPLDPPDVDILKVAHHGSADPGLPELLAETTPRTALIPVGDNTYGHPTPEALAALRAAVPDVRRTDRDGTIRISLGR